MKIIKQEEFDSETQDGVVLVDFFADWCMPCRMMGMILEEIQEEVGDEVKIVKVNVDDSENLARKFGIMSIPTMLIFKNGEMKEKHIGVWQKDELLEVLKGLN